MVCPTEEEYKAMVIKSKVKISQVKVKTQSQGQKFIDFWNVARPCFSSENVIYTLHTCFILYRGELKAGSESHNPCTCVKKLIYGVLFFRDWGTVWLGCGIDATFQ